jgi:hypothetical protein
MKSTSLLVLVMFALAACQSANSDAWKRGKHYKWIAPNTGSNVGRWVEVPDGSEASKPKRKKKTARPKREREETRDLAPAPPADRFR